MVQIATGRRCTNATDDLADVKHGAFCLPLRRPEGPVPACFGFVRSAELEYLDVWAAAALGPREAAGLHRCRTAARRLSYLSGRFAARQAVGLYLQGEPDTSFEITSGVFNQPIVRCDGQEPPAVTISHAEGFAVALAYDRGHVMGVDVERTTSINHKLLETTILTEAEQRLFAPIPGCPVALLTAAWTMKEALSKALRCGLTVPLSLLELGRVDVSADGTLECEFTNFTQFKCHTWIRGEHVLSIAMPGKTAIALDEQLVF
jgi:4'-phosphopantetheinyl transferase